MFGTTNGEIPSAGKVDMAWVQMPLPPVNLNKEQPAVNPNLTSTQDNRSNDDMTDVRMDDLNDGQRQGHDGIGSGAGGGGEDAHGDDRERQQDLDYDVADDDWSISWEKQVKYDGGEGNCQSVR